MKISIKDIIQLIIFTSIGAAILWLLWSSQTAAYIEECGLQGIPLEDCSLSNKLIEDYKSCNPFWLIMVCLVFMMSNVFRALRWKQMLATLGITPKFYNAFFSTMVGYFVNLGIPRSGEFARGALMAKYENKPFDNIFGTIILDRTLDMFSLLIMLGLGFLFCFDQLWSYINEKAPFLVENIPLYIGLALSAGVIGIVSLFYFLKKTASSSNKLLLKINAVIKGLLKGIKSIKDIKNIPLFIFYSIGIWLCYYLMNYLMFFAYAPTSHLSPLEGLLVFDFGAIGMVFPSPGGMGTYHAMIMEALEVTGVDSLSGFSFAMILFFTINMFCNILFGLMGLILLPILNGKR
ncbi:MAG: lysylphosphatidylglycerol synthase transmembrane domain-containing protein [Saprospiraceae bacterium]